MKKTNQQSPLEDLHNTTHRVHTKVLCQFCNVNVIIVLQMARLLSKSKDQEKNLCIFPSDMIRVC